MLSAIGVFLPIFGLSLLLLLYHCSKNHLLSIVKFTVMSGCPAEDHITVLALVSAALLLQFLLYKFTYNVIQQSVEGEIVLKNRCVGGAREYVLFTCFNRLGQTSFVGCWELKT